MRLAVGLLVGSLLLVGCGRKDSQGVLTEVKGQFVLDGDAELELLNSNYDPATNCIQLVQRASTLTVEFSANVCSINPQGSLVLQTNKQELLYNGVPVGAWETTAGTFRLYELCSGIYADKCGFVMAGRALKGLGPATH